METLAGGGGCCCCVLIVILVIWSSHRWTIGPEEQLLIKDPAKFSTINGPWRGQIWNSRAKEKRKAMLLEPDQYAVVKNSLDGTLRNVLGPQLFFPNAYDSVPNLREKIVLEKHQFVRLVDKRKGEERVISGPKTVVPDPLETTKGKEKVDFVDARKAVVVLNQATGLRRLVDKPGPFTPLPYERIVERRERLHVLPYEAMIVRDSEGQLTIHTGSGVEGEAGMSLFLKPHSSVVNMSWSGFPDPATSNSRQRQRQHLQKVDRIDMRSNKIFFRYEVRTKDNVVLQLDGTIFWRVVDVQKMVLSTKDPQGDVWLHAKNALIQALSTVNLHDFMATFNDILVAAFLSDRQERFYVERGVELQAMELTGFDCVDAETAKVLQNIIAESTKKLNLITRQESRNAVEAARIEGEIDLAKSRAAAEAAKLDAKINLEKNRTELIRTQTENKALQASMAGEATGMQMMRTAAVFIDGLHETVPSVDQRLELYRLHQEMEGRNQDTKNIAAGNAKLFLTPKDLSIGAASSEL